MNDKPTYAVIGLGNPGEEYALTRHNAGALILDDIQKEWDFPDFEKNGLYKALVSKGEREDASILFALPQTYMNRSGESARELVKQTGSSERLIVVHDEIDLPIGTVRLSFARGDGGHNGVKSVIACLGTDAFLRIRIGICPVDEAGQPRKPKGEDAVANFVLKIFTPSELETIHKHSINVSTALETFIRDGKEAAMNRFN